MADETTYASRRERRIAARRKSFLGINAASAGRASAAAATAFGLVLTSGVAANAAAGGPVQEDQSTQHQVTTPEYTAQQSAHSSADVQAPQQSAPSADPQFDGGTTTAGSSADAQPASNSQPADGSVTPASTGSATPASTGSSGSVIGVAQAAQGTPYSWGGTAPSSGFDCSGFINWAYEQAGEGDLPRTTHGMEAALPEVSDPQPGDIVLANNSTHAGIYVGGGQVVSATTTNGVTTHGMDESWHDVNAVVSPT